mmetsp:Transcript_19853/g.39343  ORF Transcript_19853/g.39343 Transcript_19853/m.39343 type:complete len:438 (+) Transcript_19853:100-1413(+)
MESPRKRSLPSLLGDDYGSSSDDDECETTDKKIVPLSEALTNSSPPETLPVFSNSPTEDAPPKKKKRLRFAHSDLLVTTIHFDSSLPIDPSCSDSQVEDDDADDEEAALASIMAAAQEVEEEEEVVVGKTSFMGIAAPFMDHHGSKSQAPELEHVPAPPKPAAFSFAKSVVTTVVNKKAQHNTPPLDEGSVLGGEREAAAAAVGGSSDASGGLWSMLQPKRQDIVPQPAIDTEALSVAVEEPKSEPLPLEWFCDVCLFTIETGEKRFRCLECVGSSDWCCCGPCFDAQPLDGGSEGGASEEASGGKDGAAEELAAASVEQALEEPDLGGELEASSPCCTEACGFSAHRDPPAHFSDEDRAYCCSLCRISSGKKHGGHCETRPAKSKAAIKAVGPVKDAQAHLQKNGENEKSKKRDKRKVMLIPAHPHPLTQEDQEEV